MAQRHASGMVFHGLGISAGMVNDVTKSIKICSIRLGAAFATPRAALAGSGAAALGPPDLGARSEFPITVVLVVVVAVVSSCLLQTDW